MAAEKNVDGGFISNGFCFFMNLIERGITALTHTHTHTLSLSLSYSHFLSSEVLVKKLLPLGFSRAEIRRQLYLSANNVDTAANRLLDREREGEGRREGGRGGEEESLREGERGEGVDGREKDGEEEVKKGKPFSIGKIEVYLCTKQGAHASSYTNVQPCNCLIECTTMQS